MKRILFLITIIVMVLSACEIEDSNNDLYTPHGETIQITIESLRYEYGEVFAEAPEGQTYLVIEMTVKNNDTTRRTINAGLMFELIGNEGGIYSYDAFVLSETSLQGVNTTLDPGESITGNVPFIVMEVDTTWELIFTPGSFSGRSISIIFNEDDVE